MKLNVNKLNAQTKRAIDKEYKSLIKSIDKSIEYESSKGKYYLLVEYDCIGVTKNNYEKMIEHYKGLGFDVDRRSKYTMSDHVFIDWKMEEK